MQRSLANMNKQQKYGLLVEAHTADLYRYANWKCRDRIMAEEVIQETLLRAWKAIDSLREAGASKAWLFTIFRREYARQFERKQLDYSDIENMDTIASTEGIDATTPESAALKKALGSIGSQYREALVLQVLGGFSCDEIANILNISASAVMTRVFRARKQLRAILQEKNDSKVTYG